MLIGDLAARSGMTKDTIRFYEKKGLLSFARERRSESNYIDYPEVALQKLLVIKQLKDLGFTLAEIAGFLGQWADEDASCGNIKWVLEKKVTHVEEEIRKLSALKRRISSALENCDSDNCHFESVIPPLVR